jgi:hypothetical protein
MSLDGDAGFYVRLSEHNLSGDDAAQEGGAAIEEECRGGERLHHLTGRAGMRQEPGRALAAMFDLRGIKAASVGFAAFSGSPKIISST